MNTYEITYNDGTKTRKTGGSETEALNKLLNYTCWSGIKLVEEGSADGKKEEEKSGRRRR